MQQEFIETKRFFQKYKIPLSDFWLQSCIDWCHEDFKGAPYTMKELHIKVYQQWLLLDLRDVEVAQLPQNITNEKKIVLNQHLSLQMMCIIDISKPKFSQLQKIKNLNALTRGLDDDKEKEFTPKRMLQLTLTDGVQEIKANEYKPIPALNINLQPGIKIKINPPVTIRRGQMMLEQQNVQVLDGQVDEILISHAVENVLARYLNLPENPHPYIFDESLLNASESNVAETAHDYDRRNPSSTRINRSNNQNLQQATVTSYSNINENNFNEISEEDLRIAAEVEMLEMENAHGNRRIETKSHSKDTRYNSNNWNEVYDQSRIEDEIEMLLEAENDILLESSMYKNATKVHPNEESRKSAEKQSTSQKQSKLEKDTFQENTTSRNKGRNISHSIDMFDNNEKVTNSEFTNANENIECILSSNLGLDDDLFSSLEIEQHLNKIEETYQTNVLSVKDILNNIKNKKYGKYRVQAKFKSIIQKMTLKNDKWLLEISVTDDSHEFATYIHTDLVSSLVGFTPTEAISLKNDIAMKNADATNKLMKALDQLREKLLRLDCLLEIEYSNNDVSPTIIKLL